jgi:hypothetical protein
VSGGIPEGARRVLEGGVVCHVAARAGLGPHLTPVVYALDGGRLWLTTSRGSVKARAWRRDPSVAGLVRHGDLAVAFRGRVRAYDVLDPGTWPGALVAGPAITRAAIRFGLKNARFFAGYAVDARRVPLAWTPPGRVFVAVDLVAGWVLSTVRGDRTDGWGHWPVSRVDGPASFRPGPRREGIDRRLPVAVRAALGGGGDAVLAFDAAGELTALPVRARRVPSEGSYEAALPQQVFELGGFRERSRAALTLDHASAWRAADMAGALLRGPAQAYIVGAVRRGGAELRSRLAAAAGSSPAEDADPGAVLIRLQPDSAVWWEGWASGTVSRHRVPPKRGTKPAARHHEETVSEP